VIQQGTQEWREARVGLVTASRIADVIARTKSGWGASRAAYMAQLVAERLTGVPAETYQSAAMVHGIETEAEARAAYAWHQDVDVEEAGFVLHPSIAESGASPDGLVGADGLVEIKCPATHTHIETLLGATAPTRYAAQIHWQMACTGRRWVDFVSYDPRMPEDMRLFVQRVERDDKIIRDLEEQVSLFLSDVAMTVRALQKRYRPEAAVVPLLAAG
jgi:putative phage-type endonuclease